MTDAVERKDGMDQAKWAVPRNRVVQSTKACQAVVRPRFKLHGVWLHGVALHLYIVDPRVPADSSLVTECFYRTMEDAMQEFSKLGKPFPQQCTVWVTWMNNFESLRVGKPSPANGQ